jgi:hypothetical protein
MFNLPEQYKLNKKFAIRTFLTNELTPSERRKLRSSLREIFLVSQISGETIPSIVNDEYNCQAILFFNIRLQALKGVGTIAELLQEMIKPLCVLRFHDEVNEIYSFCYKRLNQQDSNRIVLIDSVLSEKMPIWLPAASKATFYDTLRFENVVNKSDKLAMYLEMLTKTFILSRTSLYAGVLDLLQSALWYNLDEILWFLMKLIELDGLKSQLRHATIASEKVRINGEVKSLIEELQANV